MIPDLTFVGSTDTDPSILMTMSMQDYPGSSYGQTGSDAVTLTSSSTTTVPFEQFTQKADVRLRGRSMALKVTSSDLGVRWRLGIPRIDVRTDGRR